MTRSSVFLGCGLCALFFSGCASPEPASPGKLAVLVTTRDLPAGQTVAESDLMEAEREVGGVEGTVVTAGNRHAVVGATTARRVARGRIVVLEDLAGPPEGVKRSPALLRDLAF
jgi:flagella basal body P-ring formation protein FlgA